jgi:hypothetical protein
MSLENVKTKKLGVNHLVLLGAGLMIMTCFAIFVWKSAIFLPVTVAGEMLFKFFFGHLMEKWLEPIKQKLFKSLIG